MKTIFNKLMIVFALIGCIALAGCGAKTQTTIRIGALKGPTAMGLLYMMNEPDTVSSKNEYNFQMATGADELLPLLSKGELDIALVPSNVASAFYAKSQGAIQVIDINTLGVLYMVSGAEFTSISDLEGKTIYLTGKGTTPDYCLQYLLSQNGINVNNCNLEYRSEATEVAALLAENPDAIGVLPQPFVVAACAQNQALSVVCNLNTEWEKVTGSGIVTGVTVVRTAFLEENSAAVEQFIKDHEASVRAINENPEQGGIYAEQAGIVAKAAIAQKAIPNCNVTCIYGEEMKKNLSAYLEILYTYQPDMIGGAMPEETFYKKF